MVDTPRYCMMCGAVMELVVLTDPQGNEYRIYECPEGDWAEPEADAPVEQTE